MGLIDVKRLIFITGFLLSGSMSKGEESSNNAATSATPLIPLTTASAGLIKVEKPRRLDVVTPTGGVPVFNPSNPAGPTTPIYNPVPTPYPTLTPSTPTMTPENPDTAPGMGSPPSSGQSWCIASQTASQTTLQVALDYACGYGGADCAQIQPGSSCYNPNTIRDHASYAFNSYYQKNPLPTSCDFGGTAVITNVDPSTSTCQYPSTSASSSVPNTDSSFPNPTTPAGPSIYGSNPPNSMNKAVNLRTVSLFLTFLCLLLSMDQ